MSAYSASARRRFSLLASSSLAALTLATSAAVGAAVTLSPGVAAAQDECGDPDVNGSVPDVVVCTGAYPTGITYDTNGNLVMGLGANVVLNNQGILVNGAVGDNIAVLGLLNPDNTQINATFTAIELNSDGGSVAVDFSNGSPSIVGGLAGIVVNNSNGGDVLINVADGLIEGTAAIGIQVNYNSPTVGGAIDLLLGQTEVIGAGGIHVFSTNTGPISIVGGQSITATGTGLIADGVDVRTYSDITIATSGDIVAGNDGISALVFDTLVSHQVTVLTGDVTADATAIFARNEGEGDVVIETTGVLSGLQGIVANALDGAISIVAGDAINATAGGIIAVGTAGAIDITANDITSGDDGILAEHHGGGDTTITLLGDINAGGRGIYADADSIGGISIDSSGQEITASSHGMEIETFAGDINVIAGDIVSQTGVGVLAHSVNGDINITVAASSAVDGLAGGIDTFAETGDTLITIQGFSRGILAQTGSSSTGETHIVLDASSAVLGSSGHAVFVDGANGSTLIDLLGGASIQTNVSGAAGIGFNSLLGDVSISTAANTTITAMGSGGLGIIGFSNSGDITAQLDGDIMAAESGVFLTSANGSTAVYLGAGATIDPEDFGIHTVAGVQALVETGAGSLIEIDDVDADGVAAGVHAESTASSDIGGNPSVLVNLGANSLITVDGGGVAEADGGYGVHAFNSDLGSTGSVVVNAANGFGIDMIGDGVIGILGEAYAGDLTITTGGGSINIAAGDGVASVGSENFSVGIKGFTSLGALTIDTSANIGVNGVNGGLETRAIYGASIFGDVSITAGGLTQATHNGIVASTQGVATVTATGVVTGVLDDGIFASGNQGASVTTFALVTGGESGILALSDLGSVVIDANFLVQSGTRAAIFGASGTDGSVTIDAANVVSASGTGVEVATVDGDVDIEVTGAIAAGSGVNDYGVEVQSSTGDVLVSATAVSGGGGVSVFTGGGDIDIQTSGPVTAASNVGLYAESLGGDIQIVSVGAIDSSLHGIYAATNGAGAVSISAADIANSFDIGIYGSTELGELTIVANGSIQSGGTGIAADSLGGDIVITSLGSVGAVDYGVYSSNTDLGSITLDLRGVVSAGLQDAVRATTDEGDIVIKARDVLFSNDNYGIWANSTFGDILIDSGSGIVGGAGGIHAVTSGLGAVAIDGALVGSVLSGDAVYAQTSLGSINIDIASMVVGADRGIAAASSLGSINIASNGDLEAQSNGIEASTGDVGAITIYAANILSNAGNGVLATAVDGAVSITAVGVTDATTNGIYAQTNGGSILIDNNAGEISAGGVGITAITSTKGGDIRIGAGDIDAQGVGVFADTNSTAEVNSGGVITSAGQAGIFVRGKTNSGLLDVDVSGGSVTGATHGVLVHAQGIGSSVSVGTAAGTTVTGSNGAGILVQANLSAGAIDIDVEGAVNGLSDGIFATGQGDISVTTGAGAVLGINQRGVNVITTDAGDVDILLQNGGSVAGTTGVFAGATGTGDVHVVTRAGTTIVGTSSFGAGLQGGVQSGDLTIDLRGDVTSASWGILAQSTTGDISISTRGFVTGGSSEGIRAGSSGGGDISVVAGGPVSGAGGIRATSTLAGDVSITSVGAVTATSAGAAGVSGTTVSGDLSITTSGSIVTNNQVGVFASSASGTILVNNAAAISGASLFGVSATMTGGAGDITVNNSGAIGSVGDAVNGTGLAAQIEAGGTGDVFLSTRGDVYATNTGVFGSNLGLGDVSVTVGGGVGPTTVSSANTVAVSGRILNTASTGRVSVDIADSASIIGKSVGIDTRNTGQGATVLTIGDKVTIDPDDYGIDMQGMGDVTLIAGDNLSLIVGNTDNDTVATGVNMVTFATADAAAGDPRIDMAIGAGLSILVDGGAGNDADAGIGVHLRAVNAGTAGIRASIDDGLSIQVQGNNVMGVRAVTTGGGIELSLGDGLISLPGGDAADMAGIYGYSAGITALSGTGNIQLSNHADINVSNITGGGAFGIWADTGGIASIKMSNDGDIFSTGTGVLVTSMDGAIDFSNSGNLTVLDVGIEGFSGTGDITISTGAGVFIDAANVGLRGQSAGKVQFNVGADTGIEAGVAGVAALSATTAGAHLFDGVSIETFDLGVLLSAGARGEFVADNGVNLTVRNNDADFEAKGLSMLTGADFDPAAGVRALTATIGSGFGVFIDNGAGGDADGAVGIEMRAEDAGSTAGIRATIGDGLGMSLTGDSSIGLLAGTSGGAIDLTLGRGSIILAGGDGADMAGNFSQSAGIAAGSQSGAISINNRADIQVSNLLMNAYAILAQGGSGNISVTNSGQLFSTDTGLLANSASGAIDIISNGAVTAVGGTGVIGLSGTGAVSIAQGAGAVSAGVHGLLGVAAGAGNIRITNAGQIDANLGNSGGFGIFAQHSGAGGVSIGNAGVISGTALTGINANHLGLGGIAITNNAAIGSKVNPVVIGISASAANAANASAISVSSTGAIIADNRGIQATHAGAGAITIAATAEVNAGLVGIEANANGGAVSVSSSVIALGNAFGIRATNTGAGTITIAAGGQVSGSTASLPGRAAIEAITTGAGAINVSTETVVSNAGSAVRTSSNGGAVNVTLGGGLSTVAGVIGGGAGATSWVVDLTNAGAGVSTVNIGSNTIVRSLDATAGGFDDLVIRGVGGSAVINNAGQLNGRMNFAGLTGNVAFTNSSAFSWHTTGLSVFSGGGDTIANTATGSIFTNANGAVTTWDFGAGVDTFNNAGLLAVGEQTTAASTLAFSSLERWNNSGRVLFGLSGNTLDGQANDRILAPGALFTGSTGSLLVMDVNLGGLVQTGCGVLTAADCLDLTGGSTAGVTGILVHDISGATEGVFNPGGIVLVDVSGGSTAAGHFVLDPGSSYWRADASADGVLDRGLFVYDLVQNAGKHMLVSVPDSEAFEFPTLGEATQSLWYSSTGSWFERQTDLRDQLETVASPGVWMKLSAADQDRTTHTTYNLFGSSYTYDTSHDQQTQALVLGADLLSGETAAGSRWVAGAMVGYVDSDVSFDQSTTQFALSGGTIGAYGTLVHGPAFVHGLVAANQLDLDYNAPSLSGPVAEGQVRSWGFQLETGYTIATGERTFFEPLAGIARVSTSIDSLAVPGATVAWDDDQTSLRLNLGGRVGVRASYAGLDARFSLTGRVWEELEARNQVSVNIGGATLPTIDDFGGTFSDLSGAITLNSRSSAFSAFLNAGMKWNDDYRATEASAGVRYRW